MFFCVCTRVNTCKFNIYIYINVILCVCDNVLKLSVLI